MSSAQTPLHKVQGMGSSHSGTGHFWHERVTSVALIPLSLWFLYVMLGLAGTGEVTALQFLPLLLDQDDLAQEHQGRPQVLGLPQLSRLQAHLRGNGERASLAAPKKRDRPKAAS